MIVPGACISQDLNSYYILMSGFVNINRHNSITTF